MEKFTHFRLGYGKFYPICGVRMEKIATFAVQMQLSESINYRGLKPHARDKREIVNGAAEAVAAGVEEVGVDAALQAGEEEIVVVGQPDARFGVKSPERIAAVGQRFGIGMFDAGV